MAIDNKFTGAAVAMITPFHDDGTIDFNTLERHTDELIKHGVDYLVVLGTTAETPALSKQEQLEVVKSVANVNDKRVPIVVGTGGNNTAAVIEWMATLGSEAIDGYLCVAPYYNKPGQEGMYQHFSAIATSSGLPVILYNVPGRTGSNIEASTTLRLAQDFPGRIVAIKEASGNFLQVMHILRERPDDFAVVSGDDVITLPMIALGANGVISVIGNALPGLLTQMVKDAMANNFTAAKEKHYRLLPLMNAIFKEGNPTGIKALMEIRGHGHNALRLPLIPATRDLYEEIRKLNREL